MNNQVSSTGMPVPSPWVLGIPPSEAMKTQVHLWTPSLLSLLIAPKEQQ